MCKNTAQMDDSTSPTKGKTLKSYLHLGKRKKKSHRRLHSVKLAFRKRLIKTFADPARFPPIKGH